MKNEVVCQGEKVHTIWVVSLEQARAAAALQGMLAAITGISSSFLVLAASIISLTLPGIVWTQEKRDGLQEEIM